MRIEARLGSVKAGGQEPEESEAKLRARVGVCPLLRMELKGIRTQQAP